MLPPRIRRYTPKQFHVDHPYWIFTSFLMKELLTTLFRSHILFYAQRPSWFLLHNTHYGDMFIYYGENGPSGQTTNSQ